MEKSDDKNSALFTDADARLAAIVDSSSDAIIGKDLNSTITNWNRAAERLFGHTAEEAIGRSILILIPENRHAEEIDIIERVRRGERVETFDTMRLRKDGTQVPVSLTISPIKNAAGEIIGASKIARDISQAKESERRIRLLMREVNHRVKNQFAVIISMVRETAKRATNPQDFEKQMRDRIMALSRSHDLLVSADWQGASLFDLIEEHLKPFGHEEQITLSGPLLTLLPSAVQYLGMAFHELGTNSAKYGALADSAGRISVSWEIGPQAPDQRELSIVWDETSAHTEQEEDGNHRGFGSVVLQRVTPASVNGMATLERSQGHVRWTLKAPASSAIVQAGVEVDDDLPPLIAL
ncbi:MAG TPA: PAS domain S-box protein [Mesorhizobium sp.]|jgi:PAS domain S-box-containing protein